MASIDPLVTTDWLADHLDDPGVRVVDMRGSVTTRPVAPGVEDAAYRGARDEFLAGHIPGAVYVDWTRDIIDPDDPVPVQIAGPERFAQAMAERGIGDGTHVVAVDHLGGQFATRLWWALRYYGHESVSVLDGGMSRWVGEDRPLESGEARVRPSGDFTPRTSPEWRITAEALLGRLAEPGLQLLDARDTGQYTAVKRRGSRGGHIPGAKNLPRELFLSPGGGFLSPVDVRKLAQSAGLDPEAPTVGYCNGGVAATVALFQLHRAGFSNLANYDGSWNEWGERHDLPTGSGS